MDVLVSWGAAGLTAQLQDRCWGLLAAPLIPAAVMRKDVASQVSLSVAVNLKLL